jgi:hypothetical protein
MGGGKERCIGGVLHGIFDVKVKVKVKDSG